MNNPGLYTTVNELQRRDAQHVLEQVKPALTWALQETILDVGCGPGDLTVSTLKSYLQPDAKIVGCDISESMVQYAQTKYGNEQVSFKQLDIGNSNIWMNWEEERFDKIFSFYCLHWVSDQLQAAQNMSSLLKKNGHLVTMFTTSHPFTYHFKYLSTLPKLKTYAKIYNPWEAFYNGADPQLEYVNILKSVNFKILSSKLHSKSFVHASRNDFIEYFESVNPFAPKIAKEEKKEFLEECTETMLKEGLIKENDKGEYIHEYNVLITHAVKTG